MINILILFKNNCTYDLYVDDIVLFAESAEELQTLLNDFYIILQWMETNY